MHIFLHNLSQLTPENNVVPVGMFWHLGTILERVASLSGGNTQTCHSNTLLYITDFRILSYVSNQHYFVHNNRVLKGL